jgi:hypothetical protein
MFSFTSQVVRRWSSFRQAHGARASWQWLADRVGARLVNLGVSEVVWLERDDIQLSGDPPAGFAFRFLASDELARFVGAENELAPHHVERAAAGHDLCFAALKDDRLAAYGWYALGCIEAEHCDNVALSFPADVAYMYKGFTHPDFRGLRLHGFAMRLALEALVRERGVTKLVSTVDWLNFASLKSCDRLGYRRLGRMIKYGWGRCGGVCYPPAAGKLDIRFGAAADLSPRAGQATRDEEVWEAAPVRAG